MVNLSVMFRNTFLQFVNISPTFVVPQTPSNSFEHSLFFVTSHIHLNIIISPHPTFAFSILPMSQMSYLVSRLLIKMFVIICDVK